MLWPGAGICDEVLVPSWGLLHLLAAILACATAATLHLGWRIGFRHALHRAALLFLSGCLAVTFLAILQPCIFLMDRYFLGLFYWLMQFVALGFYARWTKKEAVCKK